MFKKELIHFKWSTGSTLIHKGIKYRVEKTSYGDYFLEPGKSQGETKPFNKGTLWLEKVDKESYKIII